MKAIAVSLLLLPASLIAQEKSAPSMLLGAIFNTDRAAVQYSMFGPYSAGYFQFFFGADYAEHELRGTEVHGAPAVWRSAGHFPLRTYHAGFMYSHIIYQGATIGAGVQLRDSHEYTEYTLPTAPQTYMHKAEWYREEFDAAFSAGWTFDSWLHASLTYTTRGELLLGTAIAIKH